MCFTNTLVFMIILCNYADDLLKVYLAKEVESSTEYASKYCIHHSYEIN